MAYHYHSDPRQAYEEMFRSRTDRSQRVYEEMFRRQQATVAQSLFFLSVADGVEVFDATGEGGRPVYNRDLGPGRFKVVAQFRRDSSWEERVS